MKRKRMSMLAAAAVLLLSAMPMAHADNSDTVVGPSPGIGAKADAEASTDMTLAWSIVALTKRMIDVLLHPAAVVVSGTVGTTVADGANVTFGAKADAKSTATDTTPITWMQVAKEMSFMLQNPATTPVTGTFWQATQPVSLSTAPSLVAGTAIIGKVGIDQTTPGTTNGIQPAAAAAGSGTANATAPFAVQEMVSDGTNLQRVLAPIILGDGVNGNNMLSVGFWAWNGASWDRLQDDGSKNLKVAVNASLPAGTNYIGSTGGNLVSVIDTYSARPSNTTAYAANQNWNTSLTVTAITNASPPVATIGAHTLLAGNFVSIAGVVGATGANGTWKVGTVTGTTITLLNADGTNPSAPGVWSSGGTVAQLLVFHLGRTANGTGYITKARLTLNSTTTANGSFRVYLYNSSTVTAQVDQAAYQLLWANRAIRVGYIDFTLATEGAGSDAAFAVATNVNLPYTSDAQGNIFGRLDAEAAYSPSSGGLAALELTADQNGFGGLLITLAILAVLAKRRRRNAFQWRGAMEGFSV